MVEMSKIIREIKDQSAIATPREAKPFTTLSVKTSGFGHLATRKDRPIGTHRSNVRPHRLASDR